jgi:hypothetical protein
MTIPSAFVTPANSTWTPADNGLQAASGPSDAYQSGSVALTAGTLYLVRINITKAMTVSNVFWPVASAGTGASTQTFTGLYAFTGTLLVGSADISAQLSVTPALCPLSAPQAFTAGGFIWAGLLCNYATTQPALFRTGGAGSLTFYDAFNNSSSFRYATHNVGGLTALPGTVTPTSAAAFPFFAGIA